MLAVGVGGDHRHALKGGPAADVRKGGLQRPALALVALVAQDGTALQGLQLREDGAAGLAAAVVNDDDALGPPLQQGGGIGRECLIRVQGRNDDDAVC